MSKAFNHPDTVAVGSVVYRITSDPTEWTAISHEMQKTGMYGFTKSLNATIYLNPEQEDTVAPLTLLHEVMHAISESALGSPDWKNLGKDQSDREESIIRHWEAPLLNLIQQNPALVNYLAIPRTRGDHE